MCAEKHYMVNLNNRLEQMKRMVDKGNYFVVFMDFQTIGSAMYENEDSFSRAFTTCFLDEFQTVIQAGNNAERLLTGQVCEVVKELEMMLEEQNKPFYLMNLFRRLATFHSVILAGVYDVKNLKRKLRADEAHKKNSPWNIAVDFNLDMSFSKNEIAGMLREYEADKNKGMDVEGIAGMIYDETSGYPFLVCRLCKIMDEELPVTEIFGSRFAAWSKEGGSCCG